MTNKKPDGTIWAKGTHQIYVNNKPSRVKAQKNSIKQAYNKMQEKIRTNGGLKLGFDHIPETTLKENPILQKTLEKAEINPYDVGEITELELKDDQIIIKEAQINNPYIQKLYDEGEIPAYSIVGESTLRECPTSNIDYIVNEFSQIDRVDFVMTGGCNDCRTENNMILAKLSLEDDKLTKEEIKEQEELEPKITMATIKKTILDIVTPLVEGNQNSIEAKLAEFKQEIENETQTLKIEAKTSNIESLIDEKIEAGYATPAMKKGLLATGLNLSQDEFQEALDTLNIQVWDPSHKSEIKAGKPNNDEMSVDEALKRLGR
jgi:hypothetical protein